MTKKRNKPTVKSINSVSKSQVKKTRQDSLHATLLHQTHTATKSPAERKRRPRAYRWLYAVILLYALSVGVFLAVPMFLPAEEPIAHRPHVASLTGSVHRKPKPSSNGAITPSPTLSPMQECTVGTIDIIIAHEDDDLLFMNLDIANAITAGKCVRAVYMTAGDDGRSNDYSTKREHGVESAYAFMAGVDNSWTEEAVTTHGHTVSVRHLTGHPSISLMFVRLPDGNIKGQGFSSSGNVSLEALASKKIRRIPTMDDSSYYSYEELMALVASVFEIDQPDDIFTHVASGPQSIGDHSDHRQVGQLTLTTRNIVRPDARITTFVGYPSGRMPVNVSDDLAFQKRQIFLMYAREDPDICTVAPTCRNESTYINYYSRLYKADPISLDH